MTLRALRPAGNRICAANPTRVVKPVFDDYDHAYWLNSGTAALALAFIASLKGTAPDAEVILPAYGCPDLVAAAHYAGVRPVLVDIQPESPHYEYSQLEAAITPKTVAIVAATLLGIRADHHRLRKIINLRPITLIEDSAQWFPRQTGQTFFGDLVVLSFGRGKPLSALGGGALLASKALPDAVLRHIHPVRTSRTDAARAVLKRISYNALIHPILYGLAEKVPYLHIGATVFHELEQIRAAPMNIASLLSVNIDAYRQRSIHIQEHWRSALHQLSQPLFVDLCTLHDVPADYMLPRYPLLIKNASLRNRLYDSLRHQGLGTSVMYRYPLMQIEKVADLATRFADDDNATTFADQLLTLPTHGAVTSDIVARTISTMHKELSALPN